MRACVGLPSHKHRQETRFAIYRAATRAIVIFFVATRNLVIAQGFRQAPRCNLSVRVVIQHQISRTVKL
jgi:hypothetical protein